MATSLGAWVSSRPLCRLFGFDADILRCLGPAPRRRGRANRIRGAAGGLASADNISLVQCRGGLLQRMRRVGGGADC